MWDHILAPSPTYSVTLGQFFMCKMEMLIKPTSQGQCLLKENPVSASFCTSLSYSLKGRPRDKPHSCSCHPLHVPEKQSTGKWAGKMQCHVLCGPWLALIWAEGEPGAGLLHDESCSWLTIWPNKPCKNSTLWNREKYSYERFLNPGAKFVNSEGLRSSHRNGAQAGGGWCLPHLTGSLGPCMWNGQRQKGNLRVRGWGNWDPQEWHALPMATPLLIGWKEKTKGLHNPVGNQRGYRWEEGELYAWGTCRVCWLDFSLGLSTTLNRKLVSSLLGIIVSSSSESCWQDKNDALHRKHNTVPCHSECSINIT